MTAATSDTQSSTGETAFTSYLTPASFAAKGGPKGGVIIPPTKPGGGASQPLSQWDIAGRPALKLAVREQGWYRVTPQDVAATGIDFSKVDPRTIRLFADGAEVPITVNGEADGRFDPTDSVEFFGSGVDVATTNVRTYYLTAGAGAGLRIKPATKSSLPGTSLSFQSVVRLKERLVYFAGLNNGDTENFFGRVVASQPVNQTITLQHVAPSASSAKLEVTLQGVTDGAHNVSVSLNGHALGASALANKENKVTAFTVPQSFLLEGANTVTLAGANGSTDVTAVDNIRVTYSHAAIADQNQLFATYALRQAVVVDGFGSAQVRVVDVTTPNAVQELAPSVVQTSTGYAATVQPTSVGSRSLYFFTTDQVKTPAAITLNAPSTWNASTNGADVVMISYKSFIPSLAPLVALRQSQGYRVAVVDVDDIYDEFGYGYHSPLAIKAFLQRAESTWQTKPRFALFVGDATYDPRDYFGLGNFDFVPTRLVDTAELEAASDDILGDVNGDDIPDLAIGRLPVRSVDDANAMVSKIVGYATSAPSTRSALLVSDVSGGEDFSLSSATAKTNFPADYAVQELLRDPTNDPATRAQLLGALNLGPGVVNYFGHGSTDLWRGDILVADDAQSLTNGSALSLFVVGDCLNGYFQEPVAPSLGEALLASRSGGAIAVWASSGITTAASQPLMISEFYRQLYSSPTMTIGEAAQRAKSLATTDVRRTWVLLGDPMTRLR